MFYLPAQMLPSTKFRCFSKDHKMKMKEATEKKTHKRRKDSSNTPTQQLL